MSLKARYPNCLAVPFEHIIDWWDEVTERNTNLKMVRALAMWDRYYLLVVLCKRTDALHPWIYERCREVEKDTDGWLDIYGREHYKSTIITFAGIIQEILRNPDITVGIFSHTAGIARGFLAQIKRELEGNENLKKLFPDVLYQNPADDAPLWSVDRGIVVKRKANPKEATVEGWGLVDGQPTSKHFDLMVYDDVVTKESVNTPEQIAKTTEAWELSDNLGKADGRKQLAGTRYSFADSYAELIKRGAVKLRLRPATVDGSITGKPVLFTQEQWDRKVVDQGEATIACHCAGTSVLMADWTYKAIEDVQVGDEVVGYEIGRGKGTGALLVPTRVIATNVRQSEARQYVTDAGSVVRCTPDHKWYAKRSGCDSHRPYQQLGDLKKKDLKILHRVTKDCIAIDSDPRWQYLAGILDGEGTVSGGRIVITQSKEHNPEVHARIEETLNSLGIEFSRYERAAHESHGKKSKGSTLFLINGGRHVRQRILLNAKPAKKRAMIESLYCHIGGASKMDAEKVVAYQDLGVLPVYNIQTETGNYVANGFASKNCQMLGNPLAGQQRMFDIEDLEVYEVRPETLAIYILIDPARSKKTDSDNTAMVVLGVDYANNKYLLDGFNHKMDLMERWENCARLYVKWKQAPGVQAVYVGYESFGAQADLDYFREQQRLHKLRFEIKELAWPREGGGAKVDRVQRLGPDFRSHKFYLPYATDEKNLTSTQRRMQDGYSYRIAKPIKRKDENDQIYDLTEQFKLQVHYFPFGGKKDLVDAASRIYDMEPRAPAYNEVRYIEPEFT